MEKLGSELLHVTHVSLDREINLYLENWVLPLCESG